MKTRLDLLESLPKFSIGAELGVFAGDFSKEILARVKPSLFFMVDLFEGEIESGDENGLNMRTLDMWLQKGVLEREYADLIKRGVVTVEKSNSWEWLVNCQESFLDWVYLDGSHTYRAVTRDLAGAYHAVRNGGIIAGHDYQAGFFPGVVQAVGEFCAAYGLTKELTTDARLASYKIRLNK